MYSRISFRFLAAAGLLLTIQMGLLKAQDVSVGGSKTAKGPINMKTVQGNLKSEYKIGLNEMVTVRIYEYKNDFNLVRREANVSATKSNLTTIDLTPADCDGAQCYPGAFDKPNTTDCDAVWNAQLYNSTGSLTAFPGTFVYVFSGNCAVVFQNPQNQGYAIQFNWAKLGAVGVKIADKCLAPKTNSIGGICQYTKYLTWTFNDVLISVQKHVEETQKPAEAEKPKAEDPK